MLIDTINSCKESLIKKSEVENRRQANNAFQAALIQLNKVHSDIDEILTCINTLHLKGISTQPILTQDTRDSLVDQCAYCASATIDGSLTSATVGTLSALVKAAKNELSTAWARDAAMYAEGPKGYLSMIGGLTDNPKAAKDLTASLNALSTSALTNKSAVSLAQKVDEANAIIGQFSLEPEVEIFLKKVSKQQASVLDLMAPGVLDWLKKKNLVHKLKVNF